MMLGKGHNTKSIAKELNLSVKTVESHRAHINEKLEITDASEMVCFAMTRETGLRPPAEGLWSYIVPTCRRRIVMREVQVARLRHSVPTCPACPGNLRSPTS